MMRNQRMFQATERDRGCRHLGTQVLGGGWSGVSILLILLIAPVDAKEPVRAADLWSLKPLSNPAIPQGVTASSNPIDAFVGEECQQRGLKAVCPADNP